jgi:hypothetical protein
MVTVVISPVNVVKFLLSSLARSHSIPACRLFSLSMIYFLCGQNEWRPTPHVSDLFAVWLSGSEQSSLSIAFPLREMWVPTER